MHCTEGVDHGICGRGVLLDLEEGRDNPSTIRSMDDPPGNFPDEGRDNPSAIRSMDDLPDNFARARVTFRPGDILLIRVGFAQKYYEAT
jgi:hypothetical protein